MPASSYLILNDTNGVRQSILTLTSGTTGLLYLQWQLKRNGVHFCKFMLSDVNPDLAYFVDKAQIEIWRSYPEVGLAKYQSFTGLLRDIEITTDDQGLTQLTCTAYGYLSMLGWRRIFYDAGNNLLSTFKDVAAETVLKRLVLFNASTSATTDNGRDRAPNSLGITIAPDLAQGNLLTFSASRDNLLDVLQKYAGRLAGGDIELVQLAANSYEFRFYPGQRGSDRTATVIFSLEHANMRKPKLIKTRSTERTIIIAGGRGEGIDRLITTSLGPNYSAINDIEGFLDDHNAGTIDLLQGRADQYTADLASNDYLDFEVIQTSSTAVDRQYFLGDLVTARYAGETFIKVVNSLTFTYQDGKEIVAVEMVDA